MKKAAVMARGSLVADDTFSACLAPARGTLHAGADVGANADVTNRYLAAASVDLAWPPLCRGWARGSMAVVTRASVLMASRADSNLAGLVGVATFAPHGSG
jgi:hypothetical protein